MDETRNDAPLTGEAPQTAKPQPLRRVGSFTLGVCLIAAGIFFLLAYFVPGVDWKRCCRWCGMNSARSGIRQA